MLSQKMNDIFHHIMEFKINFHSHTHFHVMIYIYVYDHLTLTKQSKHIMNIILTSNCTFLVFMELSFDKSEYKTWLSYSWFSQEHQFKLTDFPLLCPIGSLGRGTATICHVIWCTGITTRRSWFGVCVGVKKNTAVNTYKAPKLKT